MCPRCSCSSDTSALVPIIDIRVGPQWSDVGLRMKKVLYSLLLSASRSLVFAALSEICVEVGHGLIMLRRYLCSLYCIQCSDQNTRILALQTLPCGVCLHHNKYEQMLFIRERKRHQAGVRRLAEMMDSQFAEWHSPLTERNALISHDYDESGSLLFSL